VHELGLPEQSLSDFFLMLRLSHSDLFKTQGYTFDMAPRHRASSSPLLALS
jgi:hypothetical protein